MKKPHDPLCLGNFRGRHHLSPFFSSLLSFLRYICVKRLAGWSVGASGSAIDGSKGGRRNHPVTLWNRLYSRISWRQNGHGNVLVVFHVDEFKVVRGGTLQMLPVCWRRDKHKKQVVSRLDLLWCHHDTFNHFLLEGWEIYLIFFPAVQTFYGRIWRKQGFPSVDRGISYFFFSASFFLSVFGFVFHYLQLLFLLFLSSPVHHLSF